MLSEELPNWITLMPTRPINIQPESIATKLAIKVPQHFEKPFSVAAFRLDDPGTTQKRSHPAGNIQTLLMLTGCRHFQPFSDERPAASKPRVQSKTAFVLKNHGFFRTQRFEFFLGSWRISSRLLPLPGDKRDLHVLTDTQVDAASIGPAGLSALSRTGAVNGSLKWGHPTEHDLSRTSGAIPPSEALTELRSLESSELDGLTAFSEQGLRLRPYLPPASSGLRSSGFGRGLLRSTPVVALPLLRGGWLSLCQSRLLAPSLRVPVIALWTPLRGFRGKFSCPQLNTKHY